LEEHEDEEAQDPQPPFEDAVTEIFFFTRALLHDGHGGASLALMGTRASNALPHFAHSYS
jgi:hypothetical protein